MSVMSPLGNLLLTLLKVGAGVAAAAVFGAAGLLLWQRTTAETGLQLSRQDWGFLAVLGCLFLLAIYLIWAIRREITRHGG